jgi:hypothetical protein
VIWSAFAVPDTVSVPDTIVLVVVPPSDTTSVPLESTVVLLATPPDWIVCVPPLTVVEEAIPPA